MENNIDSKKRVYENSLESESVKKIKTMEEEQNNQIPFSIYETFQRRVNKEFIKYYKVK